MTAKSLVEKKPFFISNVYVTTWWGKCEKLDFTSLIEKVFEAFVFPK